MSQPEPGDDDDLIQYEIIIQKVLTADGSPQVRVSAGDMDGELPPVYDSLAMLAFAERTVWDLADGPR